MLRRFTGSFVTVLCVWAFAGCGPSPGTPVTRLGDEIIVCGQLFHTGAPVVTWLDPGGYDAYRVEPRFQPARTSSSRPTSEPAPLVTYGSWRYPLPPGIADRIRERGWRLDELQRVVDQFVIHYDACGTSRQCFKVLHDMRDLSVQFMLDIDGTIYQTLDLKERAWHAGTANSRSVGVEIANIGAYPDTRVLDKWYRRDKTGRLRITLPAEMGDGGIRTKGFAGYPARPGLFRGRIQGRELVQYDYTNEQYESLIKLTAALCRVFPNLRCDAPRDRQGEIIDHVLTDAQQKAYRGLLGHWHITAQKVDPGPAFDWFRVINGARRHLGQPPLPVPKPDAASLALAL
ncbi:MAG: N-acetylmuramoyl-L-alanine amidase [Phycisphaerae bacterium]